jgi:hypothetical protein
MLSFGMEICGWTGGLVLISAYALVSFARVSATGVVFQCLNLAGSLMLAANSAWHHAWPSVSVNLIWLGVGVGALLRKRRMVPEVE